MQVLLPLTIALGLGIKRGLDGQDLCLERKRSRRQMLRLWCFAGLHRYLIDFFSQLYKA